MVRPDVSVVMPFAGDRAAASSALSALRALGAGPRDELILADNSGMGVGVADAEGISAWGAHGISARGAHGVVVVRATAERSPAHARNVGAGHARNDWILFLDADCRAPESLLDAYFATPVRSDVGALAGEVVPALGARTLAARYGAARGFLSQEAHLAHPFRPRAVAANLLVRRIAFAALGGFYEGVRAAEDTDFSWRLQDAGWRLELRRDACVEHRYRATLGELRRQWRGYAAGRAWLARRYEGFTPEPAAVRGCRRAWRRWPRDAPHAPRAERLARNPPRLECDSGRLERSLYLALDVLLAAEELVGLTLSNRPADVSNPLADLSIRPAAVSNPVADLSIRPAAVSKPATRLVLVAERFPAPGDALVSFALTLEVARVEAAGRPEVVDLPAARELHVAYREDDGAAARALTLVRLVGAHPLRCALDVSRAGSGAPPLQALAPAALRLQSDSGARVQALGGDRAQAAAARLAALAGRRRHPR